MQVVRNGQKYTVVDGDEWFWRQFADGEWEPKTFEIFDRFLSPARVFLDIGAWIGPTALYAAPRAKEVYAFEPDAVAYRSLVKNLALNGANNVVPYPVAVADSWKGIDFGAKTGFGDSMSSVLWAKPGEGKVPAVPLEGLIIDLNPNFIKIDIEGGEKHIFDKAIMAMEQIKPTIHLSLHTPWFKDDLVGYEESIVEALDLYPYFYDENLKQIELRDAFNPNAFNSVVATFKPLLK